jgi:sRNA-binding carbon storage regulator CsrA
MRAFTRRQEQTLIVGEAIRVLVLGVGPEEVRLGLEVPAGMDVRLEETWESTDGRRRDLVAWHPDPHRLAELVAARFPTAAGEVRVVRTGVAYFGSDPCLYAQMAVYAQGLRDGERLAECRSESRQDVRKG